MKIKSKLTLRELELLERIGIEIRNIEYSWEELEDLKEDIIFKGEIANLKDDEETPLANEYANLADKFLQFEDEA